VGFGLGISNMSQQTDLFKSCFWNQVLFSWTL